VPQDITVGKFIYEIRKHMSKLQPEKAIFLFVNDVLPSSCKYLVFLLLPIFQIIYASYFID